MRKFFALIFLAFVLAACGSGSIHVPAEAAIIYEETDTEDAEEVDASAESITVIAEPSPLPEPNPEPESEPEHLDPIDEFISQMSIYEQIGQLFIARMPNMRYAELLIREHHIGGFILFGSDVSSTDQVQRLTSELQEMSEIPLFIAVDEEGGRVSRVGRLFPERALAPFAIGSTGDIQLAYQTYYAIGGQLAYLGFNMNFAPVADIWSNPANRVIGDRSFGTEPDLVAKMVTAAVEGLHSAGILAVIKHFPGHGDTVEDSHYHMAFYHHDRVRFNEMEAIPFISGIEAGAEGVMMGHIATPLILTETPSLPATFSSYFMEQILRQEMGFDGLIITDALDMGALTRYYSPEEIVLYAFLNGADILLMPNNPSQAIGFMVDAFKEGRFTEERLHESLRRILRHKIN